MLVADEVLPFVMARQKENESVHIIQRNREHERMFCIQLIWFDSAAKKNR